MSSRIAAAVAWLCIETAFGATIAQTDRNGRIHSLDLGGDAIEVRTDLRIPLEGWKRIPSLDMVKNPKTSESDGKRTWAGRIELGPGQAFRYEESLREEAGVVHLALRVTAESDAKIEGVYFWLDLPISAFGGGTCELGTNDTLIGGMPPDWRGVRQFAFCNGAHLAKFTGATGKPTLEVWLKPACPVVVQDNREWNTPTYSALVRFPVEQWAKGTAATLDVTLKLTGQADQSPAALTLDATKPRYRFDGFGGNYCFNIESPVSQYTLSHLRVAWARTEMTLSEWKPENNKTPPEANDQPDTNLRREFLLAQQIQRKGIPYAISIWHLPEWLYADPRTDDQRPDGRRIAADKWPELLECLGSYLVYAKKQYGVEPDLFSFNEPDAGVRVKFSPEEHRDAIKRIGAHFASLGLRTKMLLADVCYARGTHTYALPTANDPEALRYVGAISFHSWGGAKPEEYAAWADLADRLKLPLVVAELGVDGGAWRGAAYRTFHYALREVQMYQELVLHARPRGTMQWEFTSDYGIVNEGRDAGRQFVGLTPTTRYWFVKHFCNLTPPKATVLTTASDNSKVLVTAFAGERSALTLHVANLGAARPATVRGLPAGVKSLRAVVTSESDSFKELPPVAVEDGAVKIQLLRQSLLTLTTMPEDR